MGKQKAKTDSLSRKIELYQDEIDRRNYRNLSHFTSRGAILTGVVFALAIILMGHVSFTEEYGLFFAVFVLGNLFVRFVLKDRVRYTLLTFYVFLLPIFGIGIAMGTFLDPESNAMTIMILLCTLLMFIVDKPARLIAYALCVAAAFLICSYACKSLYWFMADVVNLVIYLSIGLGITLLTLGDRVESAENYVHAKHDADYDMLSTVLNRGAGEAGIRRLLEQGKKGSFAILDIDDFKSINDTYGHQVGDDVIREVSKKITETFRDSDIVCRLGGDEFAVFAVDLVDAAICRERLERLMASVGTVGSARQDVPEVSISVGCVHCTSENCLFDDVYKTADGALYDAKHKGKGTFSIVEA